MTGNIQLWPTPEIFIRNGGKTRREASTAVFSLLLAVFFTPTPSVNFADSGDGNFSLVSCNAPVAPVNRSIADDVNGNYSMLNCVSVVPVNTAGFDYFAASCSLQSCVLPVPVSTTQSDSVNGNFSMTYCKT